MRRDLEAIASRTDLGEADLEALVVERNECLARGDELGYARCLLVLAHVVKWVRSENEQHPFERANSLALEALPILERLGDQNGVIGALLMAAPGLGPEKGSQAIDSALEIARTLGDELLVARVLSRRAASLSGADSLRSIEILEECLEIYTRLGQVGGQASCHFSLVIRNSDEGKCLEHALRAAELYRSIQNYKEAAKSMSLALLYFENMSLADRRSLTEIALKDAQAAGNRSFEGSIYGRLSKICAEEGDFEDAKRYATWAQEFADSDGMTPKERRREEVAQTKYFANLAESMGQSEAAKSFRQHLAALRKKKSSE